MARLSASFARALGTSLVRHRQIWVGCGCACGNAPYLLMNAVKGSTTS